MNIALNNVLLLGDVCDLICELGYAGKKIQHNLHFFRQNKYFSMFFTQSVRETCVTVY